MSAKPLTVTIPEECQFVHPHTGEILDRRLMRLGDFPMNTEDPFAPALISEIEGTQRRRMVAPNNREVLQQVVSDGGVVTGHTAFIQYQEVDEEQFVKLFIGNLSAMWDLSKPALRVLTYIIAEMSKRPNVTRIDFNMDACKAYTRYASRPPIFDGLTDLLRVGIIARGAHPYQYIYNPLYAFNGDRVVFARGIIRKKIKDRANDDQLQLPLFHGLENKSLNALKAIDAMMDNAQAKAIMDKRNAINEQA